MDYKLNLGSWNNVFAVPSEIVDKHLKLAGAAQLKVLLWFLRHSGEDLAVENIAEALSMQSADVRDCLQYWVETGIISVDGGVISPSDPVCEGEDKAQAPEPAPVQAVRADNTENPAGAQNTHAGSNVENDAEAKVKQRRVLSRPSKPDMKYLSRRIDEDSGVAYLMNAADEIFGRITSNNDKAVLLLIHEHDGLPVEVIIMLLQYALSIGKLNMRYVEKVAMSWADEEINTLELAEKKIEKLTKGRSLARAVQKIIGAEEHDPTEKETAAASKWMEDWKFKPDMIRAAYERCVDTKGKYIPKYTDKILEAWFNKGIFTVEQANAEQTSKTQRSKDSFGAAYDIEAYENANDLYEEWK